MKPKKLIVHSIWEPYPEPTPDELEADPVRWVGFNPFWWKIYLNLMNSLNRDELWIDHTGDVDSAISQLMIGNTMDILASQITALGVVAYRTANFAIPNADPTPIPFTSNELHASAGIHDTVIATNRFVPTVAGWWEFSASLTFAANTAGIRVIHLVKNGTDIFDATVIMPSIAGTIAVLTASKKVYLEFGDYVECRGYQTSGGLLNVTPERFSTWASFFYVGK